MPERTSKRPTATKSATTSFLGWSGMQHFGWSDWEPPWGIEPQTYALRACHLRCPGGVKPALASCSQVAAGGNSWLLTVVRGHLGGTLDGDARRPAPVSGGACRVAGHSRRDHARQRPGSPRQTPLRIGCTPSRNRGMTRTRSRGAGPQPTGCLPRLLSRCPDSCATAHARTRQCPASAAAEGYSFRGNGRRSACIDHGLPRRWPAGHPPTGQVIRHERILAWFWSRGC